MYLSDASSIFDMIYRRMSAEGRQAELFGIAPERLSEAVKKALLRCSYIPTFYLEIPLQGEPYCDVTTLYDGSLLPGVSFGPGRGYGLQKTFDWWTEKPRAEGCSCGIEVDVSRGDTEQAAAMLGYRQNAEYVEPFLHTLGAEERLADCLSFHEKMPKVWRTYYLGLFAHRPEAPLRLAVALTEEARETIHAEPERLAEQLWQVGFTAFHGEMLKQCAAYILPEIYTELQFDLYPGGRMGDTLGIISFLQGLDILAKEAYMRTDGGAALLEKMEREGLTDGRWHHLAGCAVSKGRRRKLAEGGSQLLGLAAGVHSLKLKYRGGSLQSTKCYLELKAKMIGAE
ncbi:hypothetical protein [Selenomonas sp. KH1T6]|uniref:hypothetical protein n=1 Tax=Selenomonas sp. KH1T6 TaxID=3158784 RepID=UPI0008A81184|nr:hypothetical protein SAMN05216583_12144 [Selenomonas ruminantium]